MQIWGWLLIAGELVTFRFISSQADEPEGCRMNLREFLEESNRIEGITLDITNLQLETAAKFLRIVRKREMAQLF